MKSWKTVVITLNGAFVKRCYASCRSISVLWPLIMFITTTCPPGTAARLQCRQPVLTAADAVAQPDVDPAGQLLIDQPQR